MIEERIAAARGAIETRIERARAESRDLSASENDLCAEDRAEWVLLAGELERRSRDEHTQQISAALGEVIAQRSRPWSPTLLVSQRHVWGFKRDAAPAPHQPGS